MAIGERIHFSDLCVERTGGQAKRRKNRQRTVRPMALPLSEIRHHTALVESAVTGIERHFGGAIQRPTQINIGGEPWIKLFQHLKPHCLIQH